MNIDAIYKNYEYLAKQYSYKVFNLQNTALERVDVEQELKMKLFMSIKAYLKKIDDYNNTGRLKPVPLKFYLRTVMINKVRDIITDINKVNFCNIDEVNLSPSTNNEHYFTKTDIIVDGQEITGILKGREKKLVKIYIACNFNIEEVYKFGKSKTEVNNLVKQGMDKIKIYLKN